MATLEEAFGEDTQKCNVHRLGDDDYQPSNNSNFNEDEYMRKMELPQMREHKVEEEVLEHCRAAVDVGLSTARG